MNFGTFVTILVAMYKDINYILFALFIHYSIFIAFEIKQFLSKLLKHKALHNSYTLENYLPYSPPSPNPLSYLHTPYLTTCPTLLPHQTPYPISTLPISVPALQLSSLTKPLILSPHYLSHYLPYSPPSPNPLSYLHTPYLTTCPTLLPHQTPYPISTLPISLPALLSSLTKPLILSPHSLSHYLPYSPPSPNPYPRSLPHPASNRCKLLLSPVGCSL